jgi:hypothetical protein
MAYKIYEKIMHEQNININLDSDTLDYDISFSLKNNNNKTLQLFEKHLKILFNNLIKDYTFTFDEDTIKKYKLKQKYHTINSYHIIHTIDIAGATWYLYTWLTAFLWASIHNNNNNNNFYVFIIIIIIIIIMINDKCDIIINIIITSNNRMLYAYTMLVCI